MSKARCRGLLAGAAIASFAVGFWLALATANATTCPTQSTGSCAIVIGTTPMWVTGNRPRTFQRIFNAHPTDSLWCTRDPSVAPEPNGAGSYMIKALNPEEFSARTGYAPPVGTRCVSDGVAGGIPVAVEVN